MDCIILISPTTQEMKKTQWNFNNVKQKKRNQARVIQQGRYIERTQNVKSKESGWNKVESGTQLAL